MKKFMAGAAAVLAAATLLASCGNGQANKKSGLEVTSGGKVLNIYCWNEEFQSRVKDFYPGYTDNGDGTGKIGDVVVKWVITPNANNAYQNRLDSDLRLQEKADADSRIDIFLVEADYALKYTDTAFAADIKGQIGLTDADLSKQYKYTKDIVTDSKGVLKGVSWQACPSGLIYRRSIAKDIFGTDDPATVQEKVSDWNKFAEVAALAKSKGYYAVSGYDDTFRVFSDNVKTPWVQGNKIVVDEAYKTWIAQTKDFTDNGYNNRTSLWDDEWNKNMMLNSKVFSYFGPGWLIDFCMAADNPDSAAYNGDWAVCKGPQGFSWGGTWICAAAGTDNADLIKDIMLKLTCDTSIMTKLAKETGDFANNEDAMTTLASSDYKSAVLGGQNHFNFFLDSAKSIDKSNISKYDQGMAEKIQAAMKDYYEGKVDLDTAWDNFYTSVTELYPALTK